MTTVTEKKYEPAAGTLAWRVCNWFSQPNNAGAEMSAADLAIKFAATQGDVKLALVSAIGARLLSANHAGTYAAGPGLAAWFKANTPGAPAAAPKPAKPRTHVRVAHELDIGAIQVEIGVPLPSAQVNNAGESKYDAALDKLTKPGQSMRLPIKFRKGFGAAVKRYGKAHPDRTFAIRTLDATEFGVWRTK